VHKTLSYVLKRKFNQLNQYIMRKLLLLGLLAPLMMMGQNETVILNLTHVNVKMGHEAQFMEGMKMYKKCYVDNKGESGWNAWRQVQGSGMTMAFTDTMNSWAEMDDDSDPAGSSCRSMFTDFILPHVSGYDSAMATTMPDLSPNDNVTKDKVWVTYFSVNNSSDFLDGVKIVGQALEEIEGNKRGYWYAFAGGGPDSPDYMVAWPFDKYADLDKDMDGVWEVCAKKHGEKKTNEVRAKFRKAIDDSWSFLYDKNDDLTYAVAAAN
jgi:hypothetical protein